MTWAATIASRSASYASSCASATPAAAGLDPQTPVVPELSEPAAELFVGLREPLREDLQVRDSGVDVARVLQGLGGVVDAADRLGGSVGELGHGRGVVVGHGRILSARGPAGRQDAGMDQGWAAVIAAIVAALGGIGIGLVVGRRQLTDQATVEHEQWLRSQRQETYVEVLAEFDRIFSRARGFWELIDGLVEDHAAGRLDDPETVWDELLADIEEIVNPAEPPMERLRILCSGDLLDKAEEATASLHGLQAALYDRVEWARGPREEDTQWTGWVEPSQHAETLRFDLVEAIREAVQRPARVSGRRARR